MLFFKFFFIINPLNLNKAKRKDFFKDIMINDIKVEILSTHMSLTIVLNLPINKYNLFLLFKSLFILIREK